MARKMVFIDTSLCTGCKACAVACKAWNDLPAEKTQLIKSYQSQGDFTPTTWGYINMTEKYEHGKMKWLMLKRQCMHCGEPACMKACSSDAVYKTESGYTLVDHDKCVGCGYCEANCPWKVPKIDPVKKKAYHCTGCIDRVESGLLPACVHTCQPGALQFGDREEMMEKAQYRLAEVQKNHPGAHLYGDAFMGGTTYVYLLTEKENDYGLPWNPDTPLALTLWKDIVHPLGGLAIGGAALAVVAGVFTNFALGNYRTRAQKMADHDDKKGGH